MIAPAKTKVTLPYGATSDPYTETSPHAGVDFSYSPDNKIYAPETGKITFVGDMGKCGEAIELTAGNHLHRFCHTSSQSFPVGTQVAKGQVIGIMGDTGYAFGAHLHWIMWVNDVRVNGMNYVNEEQSEGNMLTNRNHLTVLFKQFVGRAPKDSEYTYYLGKDASVAYEKLHAARKDLPELLAKNAEMSKALSIKDTEIERLKVQAAQTTEFNAIGKALVELITRFGYKK